jgi:hypothetical protein
MVAEPGATPVTTPVEASTVAIDVLLLDHTPPAVGFDKVEVNPTQAFGVPEIPGTVLLTVTVSALEKQPVDEVYEIVEVPTLTELTTPVDGFTEACAGLLLVHVPDASAIERVDVPPKHNDELPEIEAGVTPTVTSAVATAEPHAPETVYEIFTLPVATPVTTPEASTVAIAALEELHAPPASVLESAVVEVAHTTIVPEIVPADGNALTVTCADETEVPHPVVTV